MYYVPAHQILSLSPAMDYGFWFLTLHVLLFLPCMFAEERREMYVASRWPCLDEPPSTTPQIQRHWQEKHDQRGMWVTLGDMWKESASGLSFWGGLLAFHTNIWSLDPPISHMATPVPQPSYTWGPRGRWPGPRTKMKQLSGSPRVRRMRCICGHLIGTKTRYFFA